MTENTSSADRIEEQIASPTRVWRARSSAQEFGAWSGATPRDEFAAGGDVDA
jgi:hypothetical protein